MKGLILMTRIPVPGKTKTRLMDTFTGYQCSELHKAFLKDIIKVLESIKSSTDIFITYSDEGDFEILQDIIPSWIKIFPQHGADLGEKMENAIKKVLDLGYKKVILMGSDVPQITKEDIIDGFRLLKENDLILGPTFDGGYYMVGMKKLQDIIFKKGLNWGKMSVLEGTLDICNKNSIKTGLGNKLIDIDTKEDLSKILGDIELGFLKEFEDSNTIELIKSYIEGSDYARITSN